MPCQIVFQIRSDVIMVLMAVIMIINYRDILIRIAI